MNIIDAIKSGRRFRRKDDTSWYSSMSDNYPIINISAISRENFFANDWEVEAQEVTITREQLADAWEKSRTKNILGMELVNSYPEFDALAKELGL